MAKKTNKPHFKLPHVPYFGFTPTVPPYQRPGSIASKPFVPAPPPKPLPKREDFLFEHDRKPVLQYTAKAWDSLQWLVDNCPIELGWVGAVEQVSQWHYIIHDLRVMEQEATAATFEYEDWNEATTEMIVKKTLCKGRFDSNLGHSHVNMGVRPSGTDEDQMMDLAHINEKTGQPTAKFAIQTIANKKGEHHCAIFDWENKVHYDKVPYEVLTTLTDEDITDLEMQLKRVKTKAYTYPSNAYGGARGSYYDNKVWNTKTKKFDDIVKPDSPAVPTQQDIEDINREYTYGFEDEPNGVNDYGRSLDGTDASDYMKNPMVDLWDDEAEADYMAGYTIAEVNRLLTVRLQQVN